MSHLHAHGIVDQYSDVPQGRKEESRMKCPSFPTEKDHAYITVELVLTLTFQKLSLSFLKSAII